MGKVTDVYRGTFFLCLNCRVNAVAHSCNTASLPGQGDEVGFLVTRMVKVCGVGESQVEDMLLDLIDGQSNPTIATYAKTGEVHVRVTASASDEETGDKLIKPVVKEIKKRLGRAVYSVREEETLEMTLVRLLKSMS